MPADAVPPPDKQCRRRACTRPTLVGEGDKARRRSDADRGRHRILPDVTLRSDPWSPAGWHNSTSVRTPNRSRRRRCRSPTHSPARALRRSRAGSADQEVLSPSRSRRPAWGWWSFERPAPHWGDLAGRLSGTTRERPSGAVFDEEMSEACLMGEALGLVLSSASRGCAVLVAGDGLGARAGAAVDCRAALARGNRLGGAVLRVLNGAVAVVVDEPSHSWP